LRWALGPKVSENGSISTMWERCTLFSQMREYGIGAELSTSTNLAQVWVRGIVEELHWKLIATQKHRVRIMLLGLQARAEVVQRRL
jgi:hypothetical protein